MRLRWGFPLFFGLLLLGMGSVAADQSFNSAESSLCNVTTAPGCGSAENATQPLAQTQPTPAPTPFLEPPPNNPINPPWWPTIITVVATLLMVLFVNITLRRGNNGVKKKSQKARQP